MMTLSGVILALSAFLLGFAWGRRARDPEPDPVVCRAGKWRVVGTDCAYELRCGETRISTFKSYHKAQHAADLHNGANP
jgi:hypothetical protein